MATIYIFIFNISGRSSSYFIVKTYLGQVKQPQSPSIMISRGHPVGKAHVIVAHSQVRSVIQVHVVQVSGLIVLPGTQLQKIISIYRHIHIHRRYKISQKKIY